MHDNIKLQQREFYECTYGRAQEHSAPHTRVGRGTFFLADSMIRSATQSSFLFFILSAFSFGFPLSFFSFFQHCFLQWMLLWCLHLLCCSAVRWKLLILVGIKEVTQSLWLLSTVYCQLLTAHCSNSSLISPVCPPSTVKLHLLLSGTASLQAYHQISSITALFHR